jgi:hypothetical protein
MYDNTDRQRLLDTIGEMSERFAVDIVAYVLMSNHYQFGLRVWQNRTGLVVDQIDFIPIYVGR